MRQYLKDAARPVDGFGLHCNMLRAKSLKDVVDREPSLEMAYNPNDCVELRWAAPEGSEEASTCKRHAPEAQRAKMIGYRNWFRDRHWPSHA